VNIQFYINAFGGSAQIFVILSFVAFIFSISLFIKKKWIIRLFAAIFGIYIVLEIVSLFFIQHFINYSYFVHFNLRGIQGEYKLFVPHYFALIFSLLLLYITILKSQLIMNWMLRLLNIGTWHWLKIQLIMASASIVFLVYSIQRSTYLDDKYQLFSILFPHETNFDESIKNLGMTEYITPKEIEASSGKNIIVISLESFELGYLHEKFNNLTPNILKIKENWYFEELNQNLGSEWTSGSLYTYLTGFPAFFGTTGQTIFKNAHKTEISSITHALKKADYELVYLNGDTDHSGVINLLNVFKFDKVIDYKNVSSTGHESVYGLRDKELFELGIKEVDRLEMQNQPYALFISTIDTHFPNGIYDRRFASILKPQDNDLLFMVSAVDHLVGTFIEELDSKGYLDNTTVYIFPDHLKMGDPSMFDETGERKLFILSNSEICKKRTDLYQIDLASILLNGAGIEHNLFFLSDYIPQNLSVNDFISKNFSRLSALNKAGIIKLNP